jgi:hypothetical protein
LVLGIGGAIAGGLLGALIDTGPRRVGAAIGGLFLVAPPVAANLLAIALMRPARDRLNPAGDITREHLISARKSLTHARTAIMIGLVPNGFIAVFGFLGLIGAADSNDNGALVSFLAGIGASWLILIPAIAAVVWVSSARKLEPALISDDGAWWWDGLRWQPIPISIGHSAQTLQLLPTGQSPTSGAYRSGVVAHSEAMNPPAIISAIAGILTWTVCPFLAAIVAVVAGHIALSQIRRVRQAGRGWAVTGIILGYLSVAFWVVFAVWVLLSTTGHMPGATS